MDLLQSFGVRELLRHILCLPPSVYCPHWNARVRHYQSVPSVRRRRKNFFNVDVFSYLAGIIMPRARGEWRGGGPSMKPSRSILRQSWAGPTHDAPKLTLGQSWAGPTHDAPKLTLRQSWAGPPHGAPKLTLGQSWAGPTHGAPRTMLRQSSAGPTHEAAKLTLGQSWAGPTIFIFKKSLKNHKKNMKISSLGPAPLAPVIRY